ncbi:MAG: hypothetical protein BA865_06010 [Desulfobacterales bacterium S5133MH4]|nr:MAG: hypothetical protein BA865_06010 [Desulfobacterales bacterium S5133MH4]
MDEKLRNEIEDILKGKATVEEAQEYLARIAEDDLKRLIPEKRLTQMLEEYKIRNDFTTESIPGRHVSEKEMTEIWQRVTSGAETSNPLYCRILEWLKEKISGLFTSFPDTRFGKYGMAATITAVILVAFPLIIQRSRQEPDYVGIKGDSRQVGASIQFAIVGPDGKLSRADRPLMEHDTLAFRVSAEAEGYCSLYVIHHGQAQIIIADRFLSKGVYDLKTGYTLAGNQGPNTVVMLFADAPISTPEKEKQKLIVESARSNVSSMIIEKNVIFITYQQVDVE